jgi:fumarylpyruvate hydrolase
MSADANPAPPRPPCRSAPARPIPCDGPLQSANYAAHIRDGLRSRARAAVLLREVADAIVPSGATIRYPLATAIPAYEIERSSRSANAGEHPARAALDHVFGYAVGLDMTRRDLQLAARDRGRPREPGRP